jgi:HSP20 family protein
MSPLSSFINSSKGASACAEAASCACAQPRYEVQETDSAYGLTVYLPGVSKDGLEITDEAGELRITGQRASKLPEAAVVLHQETSQKPYELVIAHDGAVDVEKIGAELKDGVLQLTLAKAESAKPRKISVS